MICRELVAVQDFGPGIAVTSHDGRTASLDGFAEAAAGIDEPGEGMSVQCLSVPGKRLSRALAPLLLHRAVLKG